MKQDAVLRVALGMIDWILPGRDGEAFAGDLLELFAGGRSRWWCLAQAFLRSVSVVERFLRCWLAPLPYCVGFVLLHPLWQRLYAPTVDRLLTRYRETLAWPGSAVLEIVAGLLPGLVFVWAGIFGYLLLRRRELNIAPVAALFSLNVGACLLLAGMVARLDAVPHDLRVLSGTDVYSPAQYARFGILLSLSLFGAISVLVREDSRSGTRADGRAG